MPHTATKVTSRNIVQYRALSPVERADLNKHIFEEKLKVDWTNRDLPVRKPIKHGFSPDAKKRMRSAIDNFALIFKSAEKESRSSLWFKTGEKWHMRKPVFLTLTMPVQTITDSEVKRNILIPFIQNLIRTYHVVNYVWKSEAQERGTIHFHLIIDTYVDHWKIRNLWFKTLERNNCNGKFKNPYQLSRLVHLSAVEDLDNLSDMLGAYMEGEKEDDGMLIHKHDSTKKVRKVEGRGWGCSDSLKYKQLTFDDICPQWQSGIEKNAVNTFEVFLAPEKPIAKVFSTIRSFYNKKGQVYRKLAPAMPTDNALLMYHAIHAVCIYDQSYDLTAMLDAFRSQLTNLAIFQ